MNRTIVALVALGLLATAGSVRAEQFENYNLYGTYIETFQSAAGAPAPVVGICQLTFDGGGNLVLGTTLNPASYCFTDSGASIGCLQEFVAPSVYTVHPDGTGSISGTFTFIGGICGSTTFSETLLIQKLGKNQLAQNVLVARTDSVVAPGDLVPQSAGPFSNTALYGNYAETLGGSIGGNSFAGICNDFFNGAGGVSGSCTLNIATIPGPCQYALSGSYVVFANGLYGPGSGIIFPTSLTGTCGPVPFGELLKIVNGTGSGANFLAGQVAAASYEANIEAGTYLLQW